MSAHQPSRQVECKVVGTVAADHATALQLLLQGMAGLPSAPVLQHWVTLKGLPREKSQPELRLIHQLAKFAAGADKLQQSDRCLFACVTAWSMLHCFQTHRRHARRLTPCPQCPHLFILRHRWIVRHEGLPLRGKGAADLPAAVRAVNTAECSGEDVLAFWQAMGYRLDHELMQEGHLYVVSSRGVHLQVRAPVWQGILAPSCLEDLGNQCMHAATQAVVARL